MFLNLKKIETDCHIKSEILDPFQYSKSNKQKTTFRKDSVAKQSVKLERSLQVQASSMIVQTSTQQAKTKKKERRKEIKQLKKFMTA